MKNKLNGNEGTELPVILSMRTATLAPIIRKWRENAGPRASWSEFLRIAISESPTVQKLAGKRYAHLLSQHLP